MDGKGYPTIFAAGYGGEFLWIVPDLDLVVVALHHNPTDFKFTHTINWEDVETIIVPAVLSKPWSIFDSQEIRSFLAKLN